jgi:hypothetical protein
MEIRKDDDYMQNEIIKHKQKSLYNLCNVTLLGIDCVNVERLAEAMNVSQKDIEFGAVKLLTSLPADDKRKIEIPHIGSIEEFSRFCIEDLYKYVDTDYVLLVQYDGFVLNAESWTDEFLKYDYIGAPWLVANWSIRDFNFPPETLGTFIVGNGGFCLRSKKFLETSARLSKQGKIPKINPEDVAMCVWYRDEFEKESIKFAPPELASLFSVEGPDNKYKKQFGFHGFSWSGIQVWIDEHQKYPAIVETFDNAKTSRFHSYLISERENKLGKIKKVFENISIEGHLLGSVARIDSDPYSDLDIWITFKNEDFSTVMENRMDLFNKIGQVISIVEAPQNAPIGGIFSAVLFKTSRRLLTVDFYLCPQSTAFITDESKKVFGDSTSLPKGILGLNPQKVTVTKDYRIDFCTGFLMTSIKKLARKNDQPLDALFREYNYLREKYDIPVKKLQILEQTFTQLFEVSSNLKEVANESQKKVITEIENFAKLVEENNI